MLKRHFHIKFSRIQIVCIFASLQFSSLFLGRNKEIITMYPYFLVIYFAQITASWKLICSQITSSHLLRKPPFCKKTAPKNFSIFTGKHLRWSLFLIKLQAFTALLKNICERLLLSNCWKSLRSQELATSWQICRKSV